VARLASKDQLDEILNDCIDRLARGETTDSCVTAYPEHTKELEPLLAVAAATLKAARLTTYSAEAKARGLRKLNEAVTARPRRRAAPLGWFGWRSPMARPLVVGVAVVLFATSLAMGADAATSDSVPGDLLYWVKSSRENISLMVPRSDMSRAQEHARLADERSREMDRQMGRGNFVEAERNSSRLRSHLNRSAQLVGLTMSTNPIEMPTRTMPPVVQQDRYELTARLQQNRIVFRTIMLARLPSALPSERRMIIQMMREQELVYRILITVLQSDGAATWAPFYRIEAPLPAGR
jgi:hypothetical protein